MMQACRTGSLTSAVHRSAQLQRKLQARRICVHCAPASEASTSGRRFALTLKKPMGMVLVDTKGVGVCVEEVIQNGNAAKAGVQVGDVLEECSAVVLKAGKERQYEQQGYGQRPYDNWDKVMFKCEGEDFDAVMAAIGSNNDRWGFTTVDLVIRRPDA